MPKLSYDTIIDHQTFPPEEWREWVNPELLSREEDPEFDRKNLIGQWGEEIAQKVLPRRFIFRDLGVRDFSFYAFSEIIQGFVYGQLTRDNPKLNQTIITSLRSILEFQETETQWRKGFLEFKYNGDWEFFSEYGIPERMQLLNPEDLELYRKIERLLFDYRVFARLHDFFGSIMVKQFYPIIEELIPRINRRTIDYYGKNLENPYSPPFYAIEVKTQDIEHAGHNERGPFYLENNQRSFIHQLLDLNNEYEEGKFLRILIAKFNICRKCQNLDYWLIEVTLKN